MTEETKNILDDICSGTEYFLNISIEYHPNYAEAKSKNLIGANDSILSCALVSDEQLKMSRIIDMVSAIAQQANIPITLK